MSDMDEEMRYHIELDAERLMREEGLSPEEARRRAQVRFGGVVKYQEAGRDVRERRWVDALWLDTRFGIRMLLKYRGLTLVGVFAMAIAVAVGATVFEVLGQALDSTLPFPGGERVVSVQFFGAESGSEKEQSLHDAFAIRDQAKSLELFGVVHTIQRNLVSADTAPEPVEIAEISASAFALTGTPAMAGRFLLPADEAPTSAPVMVIGHAAWQTRFGSDPNVVGRVVNLGGVLRTIVGVMPDGYQFPFDHQFWVPFREDPLQYPYGMGPPISTFGRLVPGATVQSAQAEISAILQSSSNSLLDGGERVRPNLVEYTREFSDIANPGIVWMFRVGQILVGALTFVVAVNLAVLVYARTVTRLGELSVRSALGASRRRILVQLFGVQMVAGRTFAPRDLGADNVVINRSFAAMYLPDVNPVGLRFHFPDDKNPAATKRWFEIVGVVADFPAFPPNLTRDGEPTIYRPVAMSEINNVLLSVRFTGPAPDTFINRLREIGADVDPALQLRDAMLLGDFYADGRAAWRSMAYAIALITLAVLLLSAAGIYALMSFTVAQRTREIGIRTALGAHPRRVLMGVFGRAAWQVGTGVIVGTIFSSAAFMAIGLGVENAMPLLGAVAAIMAVVGLLAAFGPARRGARIQVTEALRAD